MWLKIVKKRCFNCNAKFERWCTCSDDMIERDIDIAYGGVAAGAGGRAPAGSCCVHGWECECMLWWGYRCCARTAWGLLRASEWGTCGGRSSGRGAAAAAAARRAAAAAVARACASRRPRRRPWRRACRRRSCSRRARGWKTAAGRDRYAAPQPRLRARSSIAARPPRLPSARPRAASLCFEFLIYHHSPSSCSVTRKRAAIWSKSSVTC